MKIIRAGATDSATGNPEYFTGKVRLDPVIASELTGRVSAASVTFEPGARTAWHTHPAGQTLIVTAGVGRVQRDGGPVEEIRPGDVIWFEPGERHWHGAGPTTGMTHLAIHEVVDGSAVTWLEPVSDTDYAG
ncbi:cupin domain-containing protein [Pararhodobacter sp. CCB-MM2]|uniref:(R)-mandelonitrile lyase n=1 Tax=Pararhodobacter sp. CCB-MM2 TaxID=1786003 RepID=UPI000833E9A7|nr:cupin domain-containing protein [Pararhodobacter sp. CCB-MM2]